MTEATASPRPQWQQWQRNALIAGVAGLAICSVGGLLGSDTTDPERSGFLDRAQFFRSYLVAYLFCLGISLGSLALLMVHNLSGGNWGWAIRRFLEAAARNLWLMALLFLPLAAGLELVYPWASWTHEQIEHSHSLHQKSLYLNVPFFLGRAVFYFAVWVGLSLLLRPRPDEDETVEGPAAKRKQAISAPGLALLGLTITLAAVDWLMSLEPFWYSTIFGLLVGMGQTLSAMAWVIIALTLLTTPEERQGQVSRGQLGDLGSLSLAFVMLWSYLAFSQYLLIWAGDLPEETTYYLKRIDGGWRVIALSLIFLHFVLPFFLLLSRDVKRDPRRLGTVAAILLAMQLVHLFWMVAPSFRPYQGFSLHWMDVLAVLGVGGLWLAAYLFHLDGRRLFPRPVAEEGGHHG